MIKLIKEWLLYLNNPIHVAKFQKFCGLELITTSTNGYFVGTKNLNYVIKNKYLYYLFNLGSMFGDEGFLIMFFSMLLLNYDGAIGRQVMLYWSIVMYIGQMMKDFYQMDRPSSPPVVILEQRYMMEYGMPSTHAMAAVAVPAGLVFNFHKNIPISISSFNWPIDPTGIFSSQYYIYLAILASVLWCLLISFSRLYKGVHSFADVIVGVIVAIILVAFMYPWIEDFHDFVIRKPSGIFFLFVIILGMAFFYCDPTVWNSGRSSTYMILGSIFGVMLGSRMDFVACTYEDIVLSEATLTMHLIRFLLGVVVVVGCRFLFKPFLIYLTGLILKLDPSIEVNRQNKYFELLYKCSMYTLLGVMVTFVVPRLSSGLNLGRLY